mgnify:CR=1 FL=1
MLPVAKIIISGLSSIGAGMIASKLTKPLVSNANGIAKILLWFGSVGTGVAASAIVAREVELQFDATVKAVQEARARRDRRLISRLYLINLGYRLF